MIYLRPETAQGIYVNYLNVLNSSPAEGPLRHRPDRQGVPQRDHPGELHLPHPRVRADGDAVLRQAGHRRGVVRALAANGGWSGTTRLGLDPAKLRWHQHGPGELAHYAKAAYDIEYDSRSAGTRSRGSTTAATSTSAATRSIPARSSSTSTRPPIRRFVPYIIETSAGADRVTLTAAGGRLPRGGGRGRDPRGARLPPVDRADQGGGAPAGQEGRDAGDGRADLSRPQAPVHRASTTTAAPSAAATAGRTRRARRSASRSTARRPATRRSPSGCAMP